MEYVNPVRFNLIVFSVLIALWLVVQEYLFAVLWLGIMLLRLWGMRRGGYLRRQMQRKYGWE